MNFGEFVDWTNVLVAEDSLTPSQAEDVREQRELFDRERDAIELAFAGRAVGFVAGDLIVTDRTGELLDIARDAHGHERLVYFELVPAGVERGREPRPVGLVS